MYNWKTGDYLKGINYEYGTRLIVLNDDGDDDDYLRVLDWDDDGDIGVIDAIRPTEHDWVLIDHLDLISILYGEE